MNLRNFLLTLAAAAFLPACTNTTSQSADPNAPPPLRVGVSRNNAPLIYEAGRGNFDGVEAAFAKMLGQEIGRPVKFVPMTFEKLIPALQRGEVDILMSGLTVIAQRQTLVDFATPYMVSGQAAMVRSAEINTFSEPNLIFIAPFRLGVKQGAVGQLVAQRADPASTIIPYSTPDKAVRALSAKKVDLVIHDAPVLWRIMAENPAAGNTVVPKLLTKESLAWAVRRGDTALLKKANAALAKWRSNGTLDRTLRTYMPRYDVIERM
jgi:ABC-type amino acid transport substrate-binding protein